jgi:DNA (cytosine-5)-methyltransferase 1
LNKDSKSKKSLKTVSLFTGAGGLDLGLHAAGFRAKVAIEIDQNAVDTLRAPANSKWWRDCETIDREIETISSEEIMSSAEVGIGETTMLVGGPPCQPFSKSGYWHTGDAKRLADPRAITLFEYLRVLEDLLPEVFLLENVPGLAFSEKDDGLKLLHESVNEINKRAGTNYRIHGAQLNAVEYGIPQSRERVFVIAHRDGKEFEFPKPTHTKPQRVDMSKGVVDLSPHHPQNLKPFTTAWDAIGHLQEQDQSELAARGKWADLLQSIPEGHNYLYHTNRGNGLPIFGWRRRYWSMLLKLAKNRPSWTITAQPGPAIGPFHWDNRRLSAHELAALQTFPVGYSISGDGPAIHKQLGNAVPSALAEILGLEIRNQLLGDKKLSKKSSLVPMKQDYLPPPESTMPVPQKYLALVGKHEDHPGQGLGPGAVSSHRHR